MKRSSVRVHSKLYQVGLALPALALALSLFSTTASAYSGNLTSSADQIRTTGNWLKGGATTIAWDIIAISPDTWRYSYMLRHPAGQAMAFLLETGSETNDSDVFNLSGDFMTFEVGDFIPDSDSPNLPGQVHGIQFAAANGLSGLISRLQFDSHLNPGWGDFYSRGSLSYHPNVSTASNEGFQGVDSDPGMGARDGSVDNHLLVPGATTSPVPEPTTLLLLGSGLLGAGVWKRRRRA